MTAWSQGPWRLPDMGSLCGFGAFADADFREARAGVHSVYNVCPGVGRRHHCRYADRRQRRRRVDPSKTRAQARLAGAAVSVPRNASASQLVLGLAQRAAAIAGRANPRSRLLCPGGCSQRPTVPAARARRLHTTASLDTANPQLPTRANGTIQYLEVPEKPTTRPPTRRPSDSYRRLTMAGTIARQPDGRGTNANSSSPPVRRQRAGSQGPDTVSTAASIAQSHRGHRETGPAMWRAGRKGRALSVPRCGYC